MSGGANGFTLWFTGLSGAGKSTLAQGVRDVLVARGRGVEILDGVGYVARLLSRNGVVAITAAISPYREVRDEVRQSHDAPFVEVFVDCSLDELVRRDRKGLYAKALRGELQNFTGVSDPYEPPPAPDIHVRSDRETVEESRAKIVTWLEQRGLIPSSPR